MAQVEAPLPTAVHFVPNGHSPDHFQSLDSFLTEEQLRERQRRELLSATREFVGPYVNEARVRLGSRSSHENAALIHPDEPDPHHPLFHLWGSSAFHDSACLNTDLTMYSGLVEQVSPVLPQPLLQLNFRTRQFTGAPAAALRFVLYEEGGLSVRGSLREGTEEINRGGFDTRVMSSVDELQAARESDKVLGGAEEVIRYYLKNKL